MEGTEHQVETRLALCDTERQKLELLFTLEDSDLVMKQLQTIAISKSTLAYVVVSAKNSSIDKQTLAALESHSQVKNLEDDFVKRLFVWAKAKIVEKMFETKQELAIKYVLKLMVDLATKPLI